MKPAAVSSPSALEGQVLAGKYRVDRVLGVGGMGVVVAAHHIDLDQKVALKFLRTEMLHDTDAVARFAREARAAVRIKSEHVAKVTDVGRLEDGAPYMVMEYLDGTDLSGWLRNRGVLPIEQAVEFVLQACEAIAEAHGLGIVHRDLKPANLFVVRLPDGTLSVKVLDFGISKTINLSGSGDNAALTRTAAMLGSPLYMSPEQLHSSRDVDSRSDIWALGIVLYELLSGHSPFHASTVPELILKVVGAPYAPLRTLRPEVPEGLELVVAHCLQKDRAVRYQTVADVAMALLRFGPPRARVSVDRIFGIVAASGRAELELHSTSHLARTSADIEPRRAGGSGTLASFARTTQRSHSGKLALIVGCGVLAVAAIAAVPAYRRAVGPAAVSAASARQSSELTTARERATGAPDRATAAPVPTAAAPAVPASVSAAPAVPVSAAPVATASAVATASPVRAVPPKARVDAPPFANPGPTPVSNIFNDRK